jgi:restriction system protein
MAEDWNFGNRVNFLIKRVNGDFSLFKPADPFFYNGNNCWLCGSFPATYFKGVVKLCDRCQESFSPNKKIPRAKNLISNEEDIYNSLLKIAEGTRKERIKYEEKEKITKEKFMKLQREKGLELFENKWVDKKEILRLKEIQVGLGNNFKNISPYEFENFIARLFTAMGYKTQVTKKSGDYGIDVIAKKDNDIIAIQAKKYHDGNPVGNRDVQRLLGAMQLKDVKANHSIMITTSHFTVHAREQAKECAIELWDKQDLHKMVRKYLMEI